jgi:hypothetical protein
MVIMLKVVAPPLERPDVKLAIEIGLARTEHIKIWIQPGFLTLPSIMEINLSYCCLSAF